MLIPLPLPLPPQVVFALLPGLFVRTDFRVSRDEGGSDDDDDVDDDEDDEWDDDYFTGRSSLKSGAGTSERLVGYRWLIRHADPGMLLRRLTLGTSFFEIPKVKYLLHNSFLLMYIGYVTRWLLTWPTRDGYHSPDTATLKGIPYFEPATIFFEEGAWWLWTAARVVEELNQVRRQGSHYLSSIWNWVDAVTDLSITSAFVLRMVAWLDADGVAFRRTDGSLGFSESDRHAMCVTVQVTTLACQCTRPNATRTTTQCNTAMTPNATTPHAKKIVCPGVPAGRVRPLGAADLLAAARGLQVLAIDRCDAPAHAHASSRPPPQQALCPAVPSRRDILPPSPSSALPLSRPFALLPRLAGMLLLILWNMLPEIFNWSVLVVFITVGFGITCTILMPGMMWATEELNRPFYIPWLAIIGDFDIQVPPLHVPLPSTPCLQVVIPPCSFRCLCPSPPLLSGRLRLLWVDALVARHAAHVGHLRGGAAVAVHQDGQSGRLGSATAGHHELVGLHLKAWGCPPHS